MFQAQCALVAVALSGQHGDAYFGGVKRRLYQERFLELEELRG